MQIQPQPFFLDTKNGKLFAVFYAPKNQPLTAPSVECKGTLLHVPAFGDEMNKSRAIVASQARELTEKGYSVMTLDLYGTGDSAGSFAEADLDIWCANIRAGLDWLSQKSDAPKSLWGLRLGCLLTAYFLYSPMGQDTQVSRLLFWQPVTNGALFCKQFLRLRIASNLMSKDNNESQSDLQDRLAAGETLEIGGYPLSAKLYSQLSGLDLTSLAQTIPDCINCPVDWLEVNGNGETLSQASQSAVEKMTSQASLNINSQAVTGNPFWNAQELVPADALVSATTDILAA